MTGGAPPIGEEELQAFVDGRLAEPRLTAVEAYLAGHPEIAARSRWSASNARACIPPSTENSPEPVPPRLRIANIQAARRAPLVAASPGGRGALRDVRASAAAAAGSGTA